MVISRVLDDRICCPLCRSGLQDGAAGLVCTNGHAFPVIEGIPVLLEQQECRQYAHQIKYFTAESSHYSEEHVLAPWMRKFVDMAAEWLQPACEGAVALDIGCGTGYMTIELARLGYTVVAADLTLASVMVLARKAERLGLRDRVIPVVCSALALPLRDASVDALVANAVIEHLPDDRRFAQELGRVVTPDGGALLVAPVRLGLVWPFFWLPNTIHDRHIGHLRRYDAASFRNLLEPIGFSIKHVCYSGHLLKVFGVLLQTLVRGHAWDDMLERIDARAARRAYGSSNIAVIAKRVGGC